MQNPVGPEGYEWLEQDDFSSNRHLALMPWFVACPGANPVPLLARHAQGAEKVTACCGMEPSVARRLNFARGDQKTA